MDGFGYYTVLLCARPDQPRPWSTGPLIGEACGPLVYFPMVWSRCDDTSAWAAHLAEEHGLRCFDPQSRQLRTSWGRPWRFELTSARGHALRDPGPDLVRKILVQVSADHGAPDQHHRAEVTDVEEVVRAFVGFIQDDPTIARRLPWRPYAG